MECGVVIAEHLPGDEGYDVLSNFMGPFSLHAVMAMALKVPGNKLRHRVPRDSGGSFGVKQAVFPYVVLMCLASRKAGAPVKWVEDRLEHLSAATSATARLTTIEAAVTPEGRVLALRYDQADEVGAYLRAPEPATFYRMHGALTGAYAIEHLAGAQPCGGDQQDPPPAWCAASVAAGVLRAGTLDGPHCGRAGHRPGGNCACATTCRPTPSLTPRPPARCSTPATTRA